MDYVVHSRCLAMFRTKRCTYSLYFSFVLMFVCSCVFPLPVHSMFMCRVRRFHVNERRSLTTASVELYEKWYMVFQFVMFFRKLTYIECRLLKYVYQVLCTQFSSQSLVVSCLLRAVHLQTDQVLLFLMQNG